MVLFVILLIALIFILCLAIIAKLFEMESLEATIKEQDEMIKKLKCRVCEYHEIKAEYALSESDTLLPERKLKAKIEKQLSQNLADSILKRIPPKEKGGVYSIEVQVKEK